MAKGRVIRPPFITLEGGDGVGKSTQARMLARRAQALGLKVEATRQPGATMLGADIRRLVSESSGPDPSPKAELLLYLADRAEHVEKLIRPALAAGKVVICDRFADSSEVYQGVARGLGAERIREWNRWICGDLWPDITILLDMDPEHSLARADQRQGWLGLDRMEAQGDGFHAKVRQGFLDQAAAEPERIKLVKAQAPQEEVAQEVWELVEPFLRAWKKSCAA